MKSLDKNFRHLSREDKLKQLVDYGWLDKTNYQTLLSNPVIDEEVATVSSKMSLARVRYQLDYYLKLS